MVLQTPRGYARCGSTGPTTIRLLTIAGARDFDAIITDPELAADVAGEFRAAGVPLEVAD